MRRIAIAAAAILATACTDLIGPDTLDWEVSGVVTVDGVPTSGVLVGLGAWYYWGSPPPSHAVMTDAEGRFTIHAGQCSYSTLRATHAKYRVVELTGFFPDTCPSRLTGIRVKMEPYPPLTVSPAVLPDGALMLPYEEVLVAEGGDGNMSWTVTSGTLPDGLELQWDRIVGTPTTPGTWTFTILAASGDQQVVTREYTIEIVGGPVVAPTESCAAYPDTAIVGFGDTQLYHLVRAAAGLGEQDLVTCAAAATVTALSASNIDNPPFTSLQSVDGLQNLTSLETLDLSANPLITDVHALEGLTGLVSLNLSYAGLRHLTSLAGLTSLTRLDVHGLEWQTFDGDLSPLASLTSLTTLDISADKIDDLTPLAAMTALDTLRAGQNTIVDVGPLAALTSLRHLELYNNPVASVDGLASLTGLTHLDLDWTYVDDLTPMAGMTGLTYLVASRRDLSSVNLDLAPLSGMTGLVELGLSQQRITDTSPLDGLPALEKLTIWSGDVPVLALADLPSLEELVVGNASVGSVTLTGMPSLRLLRLSDNDLSDLAGLVGLDALVELYLDSNDIVNVGALQGLTALGALSLAANLNLTDIQPLIDNPGLGAGDWVEVYQTRVSCASVSQLVAKGVSVSSACGT